MKLLKARYRKIHSVRSTFSSHNEFGVHFGIPELTPAYLHVRTPSDRP